ncbi:pentatricopeptide repeat-containing protein At1g15480, mitochondrial-like [Salvia miltiorrhiza]|uniref:pentatricopeptide repeat-containing protein At1g15480, mitochondrial-like n=1 Tax=Salvia miltiorrhiza TaxID=226208 RepID=UPI0025ACBC24|nr:pentatricopeptide repeat-containing protein At1g15480, mitochondrial-like [Salvia miltiorrhiza]
MWALRRASIYLRNRGSARICSAKSQIASCYSENYNAEFTASQVRRRFCNSSSSWKSSPVVQYVSSLIGAKSSGDHNGVSEDASSGLETRDDDDDDDDDELEVLDDENDVGEVKSPKTVGLTKVVLSVPPNELRRALDEWVEAGNQVTPTDASFTLQFLSKRHLFGSALKLFDWLDSREKIEFTESDYSTRVDVIAKVQGTFKAEEYIRQIPESFRTEIVFNTLLRAYVIASNVHKAEKLFRTMKNLFPLKCASYNKMLFLYKRFDRKRFTDLVSLMEKEKIKPSSLTYQILIDVKGHSNNIHEVEQIFEKMKSDGVEPRLRHRASLAKYYIAGGLKDKAEAVLKEMEGGDLVKNRAACYFLLPVYASLGKDNEVGRIWRACESNPTLGECIVAIKAWGRLKRIKDAEAVFEEMFKILGKPSSKYYAILLNVYADHRMVSEGEDLFRRLRESCTNVRVQAWDALVKLYVGVGDVEKADAILEEAIQHNRRKPNFGSYLKVLDGYAGRGDVQNTEKIFTRMRYAGYTKKRGPFHSLLYAYINAKTAPADGFGERMRRDRVHPDNKTARLLARTAAFRKPPVSSGGRNGIPE